MRNFANGILLDCVRIEYSVQEIKRYIDILARNPDTWIHLHLTDNENTALESPF